MTDTIRVEIDDAGVVAALNKLLVAGVNLRPALVDIGEELTESTKQRFSNEKSPDGKRWAPNSDVTLLNYLGKGGIGKKRLSSGGHNLTKKGIVRLGSKKILTQSGVLSDTIHYSVSGNSVEIGSNRIYSATMQFGAKKGTLGPNAPWGNIPARPYLGLSSGDDVRVLDIISDHLLRAVS